jgi:TM2 domain-containing membrane protein YozV
MCSNVLNEVRLVFYLSRIFGVSPVAIVTTGEKSVEFKPYGNITGNLCSVILFCATVAGLIFSVIEYFSSHVNDAGELVHNALCHPMMYLSASVSIVTHCTKNRFIIAKLLEKLSSVNKTVIQKKRKLLFNIKKHNECSNVMLLMLFWSLVVFLCCDTLIWGRDYLTYVVGVSLRIAHLVNFMIVAQFCKFVKFIQFTLRDLTKIITVSVEKSSVCGNAKCTFTCGQSYINRSRSVTISAVETEFGSVVVPYGCDLSNVNAKPQEAIMEHNVVFCRYVYNDIYDANTLINSIYGISVLFGFMLNAILSITNIYYMLKVSNFPLHVINPLNSTENLVSKLCWLFMYIATVFYMTLSCHLVTSESNTLIYNIEKVMLLNPLQRNTLKQLKYFSNQIYKNPIKITASWFFTVDMALFCAYVASTITYTVVLVQFN